MGTYVLDPHDPFPAGFAPRVGGGPRRVRRGRWSAPGSSAPRSPASSPCAACRSRSSTGRGVGRAPRASGRATCWPPTRTPAPSSTSRSPACAVYDELEARLGDEARIRRKGALVVHPEAATWAADRRGRRGRRAGARLLTDEELRELEPALTGAASRRAAGPGRPAVRPASGRARAGARGGRGRREVRTGARSRRSTSRRRVRGVRTRRDGWPPARSCSRPGRGRRRWRAAPASRCRSSRARASSSRLRRARARDSSGHKVVDGSYLARGPQHRGRARRSRRWSRRRGRATSSSAPSRERRGFDTAVEPAVSDGHDRARRAAGPGSARPAGAAAWAGLRPWLPDNLPAIGPSRAVAGALARHGPRGRRRRARPGDRAPRRPGATAASRPSWTRRRSSPDRFAEAAG